MSNSTEHEPKPILNDNPAIWPIVIQDMKDRDAMGREKHGVPLQPFNGRSAKWDKYQEALDLVAYFRQDIWEDQNLLNQVAVLTEERDALEQMVDRLVDQIYDLKVDLRNAQTKLKEQLDEEKEKLENMSEQISSLEKELEDAKDAIARYD
jgi:hypothetical protein